MFENRFTMCSQVLEQAKRGNVEIVTSAFTLAEVCKNPDVLASPLQNLSSYFERSYILTVPVDLAIAKAAQELQSTGLVGIKPPDAIHIASARRAMVKELHSFDKRILSLDGQFKDPRGDVLRICKPSNGSDLGPLFEEQHTAG
jgi:predicted nucleic acid-binding protein